MSLTSDEIAEQNLIDAVNIILKMPPPSERKRIFKQIFDHLKEQREL